MAEFLVKSRCLQLEFRPLIDHYWWNLGRRLHNYIDWMRIKYPSGLAAPREITSAVLGENVRTMIRDSTPENGYITILPEDYPLAIRTSGSTGKLYNARIWVIEANQALKSSK